MAEYAPRLTFKYRPGQTLGASAQYYKRFLPYISRSTQLFLTYPLLAFFVVVSVFPKQIYQWTDHVVASLISEDATYRNDFVTSLSPLLIMAVPYLMIKAMTGFRARYLQRHLDDHLKAYPIHVSWVDNDLIFESEAGTWRLAIDRLLGVLEHNGAYIVGAGLSALIVPAEAFTSVAERNLFLRHLAAHLNDDAKKASAPLFDHIAL